MPKPQGQPTKRPKAIASVLLTLMEAPESVVTRRGLLATLRLPPAQLDNIIRRLEAEGILAHVEDKIGILDQETAASKAIGHVFRAEGLAFSLTFHGRTHPPLPEHRRVRPLALGSYLPRLVWSPWNRYLVHQRHFFTARAAMLYARIFASNRPERAEDAVLMPELHLALRTGNPVAAIADTLTHRTDVLDRLMARAGAALDRRFRVALQVSPRFYAQTFDALPFGGVHLDGRMVRLRELSGDVVVEAEYWGGDEHLEWTIHPATALVRLIIEREVAKDYSEYIKTRQLIAKMAPEWQPKHPLATEIGKAQRIL